MSAPYIILDCLPSFCQKIIRLEVWRSYNTNNFACFLRHGVLLLFATVLLSSGNVSLLPVIYVQKVFGVGAYTTRLNYTVVVVLVPVLYYWSVCQFTDRQTATDTVSPSVECFYVSLQTTDVPSILLVCVKFTNAIHQWYTRHTTNETVRSIAGCSPVSERVKCSRLKFFGHLARSAQEEDYHRVVSAALRPPSDWRRHVGRPRTT